MPKEKRYNLAKDIVQAKVDQKKLDVWYDRVFVRVLIKSIQKLDTDIWARVYPDTKLIVFFRRNIIFYKVLMTEENIDKTSIAEHVKKASKTLRVIKLGLIPAKDMAGIGQSMRDFNASLGKKF